MAKNTKVDIMAAIRRAIRETIVGAEIHKLVVRHNLDINAGIGKDALVLMETGMAISIEKLNGALKALKTLKV